MEKRMESTKTLANTTPAISERIQRKIAFLLIDVMFVTVIVTVSYWRTGSVIPPVPPTWMLPLFMLATFRMARTISFNEIGEALREPFTEVKADSCGAGANVHPKGGGFQYVLGSLMACPICSGTWSALALYTAWVVVEPVGRTAVFVLAFAGGSEMLHWMAEFFEWSGRATRVVSGAISPDKE